MLRSLVVAMILWAGPLAAAQVRVVDGDTLVVDGQRTRLFGIDAPERAQRCGRGGAVWRCGLWSGQVLQGLVSAGAVLCEGQGQDRYGRQIAVCRVAGRDLGAALVAAGAAVAYVRYSQDYAPEEARAKAAGLGIWAGEMQAPEAFRHAAGR